MELHPFIGDSRGPCCLWYGSCWIQGQMVSILPRHRSECLQCVREQLVERGVSSPPTRLPQVR